MMMSRVMQVQRRNDRAIYGLSKTAARSRYNKVGRKDAAALLRKLRAEKSPMVTRSKSSGK